MPEILPDPNWKFPYWNEISLLRRNFRIEISLLKWDFLIRENCHSASDLLIWSHFLKFYNDDWHHTSCSLTFWEKQNKVSFTFIVLLPSRALCLKERRAMSRTLIKAPGNRIFVFGQTALQRKRRQLSTTMSRTKEQEGLHFSNWGTQLQFELGIEFLSLIVLGKG